MAAWVKICPKCNKKNKGHREDCIRCHESLRDVKKVQDIDLPEENLAKTPEMKKICPMCGAVHSAKLTSCPCGGDLGNVAAVPEDKIEELKKKQAEAPQESEPKEETTENELVRLCENLDCNHINPVEKRECEKCHAPILKRISRQEAEAELARRRQATQKTEPEKKIKATFACLHADESDYKYEVKEGKTIIGRQNDMREHLKSMLWVGRKHAEINFENGILTVKDLESENHTYINGKKVKAGELSELSDGDVLTLGDKRKDPYAAFFTVELH